MNGTSAAMAPTSADQAGPPIANKVNTQKRKRSAPREMSSNHKTLNSDSESDDEQSHLISPHGARFPPYNTPLSANSPFSASSTATPPTAPGVMIDEAVVKPLTPALVKRGRGRPRKYPKEPEPKYPKRPRGRPRKNDVIGQGLGGICSRIIEHSAALTQRLASQNMPHVVAHFEKGIALAQYLQEHSTQEGTLEATKLEYIEAYTRDRAS